MSKPQVMGFYHPNGLVPSWNQAKKFAGEGGKIATLPDIIEARLATKPGDIPWENYFTTSSAEFFGYSKGGNKILIVAHNVGPMSTVEGILNAYSYEYNDKERNHRGGRISQQEFWDLESGKYGEVEIVDFSTAIEGLRYPFLEILNDRNALWNDLLKARLGKKYVEYILFHSKMASEWHKQNGHGEIDDPYIIKMGDANNCGYQYYPLKDGEAFAHLISISGLTNVHHELSRFPSLVSDIDCHEWSNGTRFVGIQKNAEVKNIDVCSDASLLLKRNWKDLMIPVAKPILPGGLKTLIRFENNWFTEYPKKGSCMDTGEPEYLITSLKPVGRIIDFKTRIMGYHGFYRYDVKELETIAHSNANAYFFTNNVKIIWDKGTPKYHIRKVQFYRAEIDYSRRLTRTKQLWDDYETMMNLILK